MDSNLPDNGQIILYQTQDGKTDIQVTLKDETVWLTQNQMAELFQRKKSTISEHIENIFREGELDERAVVRNFRTTASDGKTYNINFYNLDVIISVGYRVKSHRGTQFRIWATQQLREYIVNGIHIVFMVLMVLTDKIFKCRERSRSNPWCSYVHF